MVRNRTTRRIERAAGDGRLVRVVRRKGWDVLSGSIVGLGEKWLVMADELDAGFDGHTLIRRSDVREVEDRGYAARFIQRALAAEGHWPLPELDGIDLTTTQAVLQSAARLAPMMSVHYENEDPDDLRIGAPHDFKRRGFKLQLVTTAAEWDFSANFRYRRVSRIGIGGAYQDRLAAIAGAAPDPRYSNATYENVRLPRPPDSSRDSNAVEGNRPATNLPTNVSSWADGPGR